jgi:hypothetical protein
MIDELLISYLNGDAAIAAMAEEIAIGQVPVDADGNLLVGTYIWISNFDESPNTDMTGGSGLSRYKYDVEVCSLDDSIAKPLARLVQKRLRDHHPQDEFGSILVDTVPTPGVADAIYVESKDETYRAVNARIDPELTIIAMDVEIVADDSQDDIQGDQPSP